MANGGVPKAGKASGDNSAIALLAVVGNKPPANVTINEFTTVASVWTSAQFLDGAALKGHALGLKIAADNVPNFVLVYHAPRVTAHEHCTAYRGGVKMIWNCPIAAQAPTMSGRSAL